MKPVSWSFSALSAFETCPRQFYLVRVAKVFREVEGEALKHGNAVHKAFELRMKGMAPLPDHLVKLEPLVTTILKKKGEKLVEAEWAINKSFQPVSWFDKSAWCRAKVDAGVVEGTRAALFDWKTGKRKLDSDQLKLSAGMAFAHYPNVEQVVTGFAWINPPQFDPEKYSRSQVGDIWGTFLPRVARLEEAHATGRWEPRPSGLCRNYCPVPNNKCEFSGRS